MMILKGSGMEEGTPTHLFRSHHVLGCIGVLLFLVHARKSLIEVFMHEVNHFPTHGSDIK